MSIDVAAVGAALSGLSLPSHALHAQLGGPHSRRGSGQSENFAGFRPYTPSDERRRIDARASARAGTAMVRLFEREAVGVLELVLDASPSMAVGHELSRSKLMHAATLCVALGALAGADAQQVGLSVLGQRGQRLLPAAAHPQQAQRLARALGPVLNAHEVARNAARASVPTAQLLAESLGWLRRRSEVVVLSDGLMPHPELTLALSKLIESGRPTLLVQLWHPVEQTLHLGHALNEETVRLVELEGDGTLEVDVAAARAQLQARIAQRSHETAEQARRAGARFAAVDLNKPLRQQLLDILTPRAAA